MCSAVKVYEVLMHAKTAGKHVREPGLKGKQHTSFMQHSGSSAGRNLCQDLGADRSNHIQKGNRLNAFVKTDSTAQWKE